MKIYKDEERTFLEFPLFPYDKSKRTNVGLEREKKLAKITTRISLGYESLSKGAEWSNKIETLPRFCTTFT